MKIGILTYHRSHNYGALLQAVALRNVLKNMGNDVYYIDYFPEYHRREYKLFSWYEFYNKSLKAKLLYAKNRLLEYPYRKQRCNNFMSFIKKEIEPYCKTTAEPFDLIIYGSDQIWRVQKSLGDFNPVYFGINDFNSKRQIAYAASMGNAILTETQQNELIEWLPQLDNIAVREQSLDALLGSLGIGNVKQVVDPTFLLTADEWNTIIPHVTQIGNTSKYVLLYDLLKGSFNYDAIKKFAAKHEMELIEISGSATRKSSPTYRSTAGPSEFIDLIRDAAFVFTSSFHGLAFSIIYNKQFFAAFKKNADRAFSLLGSLGISDRLLESGVDSIPFMPDIIYTDVNNKLRNGKLESIQYLQDNCKLD